jgi:hypothetical protein
MDLRRKKNDAAKAASKGESQMGQLFVYVNLSKSAALRAGETRAGFIALPVTSAMILALTPDETGALESHVGEETDARGITRLDVGGLDTASLKAALAAAVAHAAAKVAAEAEKRAADERRLAEPVEAHIVLSPSGRYWLPRDYVAGSCTSRSYYRAEIECLARNTALDAGEKAAREEASRIAALDAAEQEAQFEALVSALLSDEQRERLEAGCLPVKERDAVTRGHLFAAFAELAAYEKMTVEDIAHSDGCYAEEANFEADEVELTSADLDADQFAAWKRIAALVEAHANAPELELRCHDGKCSHCGEEVRRYGAKVTINLASHSYSREFAL